MNRRPERLGDLLPGVLAELAARHLETNGDLPMPARHIVVADVETNGLDPDIHQAVEVAWWNLTTGERGRLIPSHDVQKVLAVAEVKALQINRYIDRIADNVPINNHAEWDVLRRQLAGNTLAGSNPAFDAAMIRKLIKDAPWHHRLFDLSAYAAGVLGLDELPGLAKVCELLDVEPGDHTAEADVTATGECFIRLRELAAARPGRTAA